MADELLKFSVPGADCHYEIRWRKDSAGRPAQTISRTVRGYFNYVHAFHDDPVITAKNMRELAPQLYARYAFGGRQEHRRS